MPVPYQTLKFNRRPVPVNQPSTYPGSIETYANWTNQIPFDGWLYDTSIYYLPYRFTPAALCGSEYMRRANLVRHKVVVLPVSTLTVAAYDTYEIQLQLLEGTRIWGLKYMQFSDAAGVTEIAPTAGQLQLTDACSGVPLFQDYVDLKMFSTYTGVTGRRNDSNVRLLTGPRLVSGPGQLNVEIANTLTDGSPLYCQVLLLCAEPVVLVSTPETYGGKK